MRPSSPVPHRLLLPALALAALVPLAGCGGTGDTLSRTFGLTRDAPDEFTVTTRAPLSMPPDFSLRPPEPGATRPQELTSRQAAEASLAPDTILRGTAGPESAGQQALVAEAGPPAPADIRAKLDADGQLDRPSTSFTDRLMFWKTPPQPGTVVDATAESRRLRQNAALGRSPEAGDTPIIQPPANGSLFGNLF